MLERPCSSLVSSDLASEISVIQPSGLWKHVSGEEVATMNGLEVKSSAMIQVGGSGM
jgi:hypothetical protein